MLKLFRRVVLSALLISAIGSSSGCDRLRESMKSFRRPSAEATETSAAAHMKFLSESPRVTDKKAVVQALNRALAAFEAGAELAARSEIRHALTLLPAETRAAARLNATLKDDDRGDLSGLVRVTREVRDNYQFEPVAEADTPRGWPSFTTPGEVEVKSYPAYRMARTKMGVLGSNAAFWRLFGHIKSNGIPMTAPVQNDYAEDGNETTATMAFLYQNADVTPAEVDPEVEIITVEGGLFASLGLRGNGRDETSKQAGEILSKWLESHPHFEALAGYRTLGWNSPYVPNDRQYREVQVPIRQRKLTTTPVIQPTK